MYFPFFIEVVLNNAIIKCKCPNTLFKTYMRSVIVSFSMSIRLFIRQSL